MLGSSPTCLLFKEPSERCTGLFFRKCGGSPPPFTDGALQTPITYDLPNLRRSTARSVTSPRSRSDELTIGRRIAPTKRWVTGKLSPCTGRGRRALWRGANRSKPCTVRFTRQNAQRRRGHRQWDRSPLTGKAELRVDRTQRSRQKVTDPHRFTT
jgi:hypothetical protein